MIKESIERLEYLCKTIPTLLLQISETEFSVKTNPLKWSKKEIIGHLIDSATNNHHRIVRGQFEERPKITYDNAVWNSGNHYQQMTAKQIVSFWTAYNNYLSELIKHIPIDKMHNEVETGEEGDKNILTLENVIIDYIDHMEYHLHQVIYY
ncbi:MAG: DinB family protein [Saprospiraceae bacterium]|nr:DinB family protein [Saprospiraceae bacterium]MBK7809662.1 DinB family protein [Saprospiraceae bacterium]MBK9632227.1 DinB family protein [Saprospiraceae bacterium]